MLVVYEKQMGSCSLPNSKKVWQVWASKTKPTHLSFYVFCIVFFFFLNKTNNTSSIMEDDHLLENQVGVF